MSYLINLADFTNRVSVYAEHVRVSSSRFVPATLVSRATLLTNKVIAPPTAIQRGISTPMSDVSDSLYQFMALLNLHKQK